MGGKSKPDWVGKNGGTSPYDSTWFVYASPKYPRKKIYAALEAHKKMKIDWVLAESLKAARYKVKNMSKTSRAPIGGMDFAEVAQDDRGTRVKRKRARLDIGGMDIPGS